MPRRWLADQTPAGFELEIIKEYEPLLVTLRARDEKGDPQPANPVQHMVAPRKNQFIMHRVEFVRRSGVEENHYDMVVFVQNGQVRDCESADSARVSEIDWSAAESELQD